MSPSLFLFVCVQVFALYFEIYATQKSLHIHKSCVETFSCRLNTKKKFYNAAYSKYELGVIGQEEFQEKTHACLENQVKKREESKEAKEFLLKLEQNRSLAIGIENIYIVKCLEKNNQDLKRQITECVKDRITIPQGKEFSLPPDGPENVLYTMEPWILSEQVETVFEEFASQKTSPYKEYVSVGRCLQDILDLTTQYQIFCPENEFYFMIKKFYAQNEFCASEPMHHNKSCEPVRRLIERLVCRCGATIQLAVEDHMDTLIMCVGQPGGVFAVRRWARHHVEHLLKELDYSFCTNFQDDFFDDHRCIEKPKKYDDGTFRISS